MTPEDTPDAARRLDEQRRYARHLEHWTRAAVVALAASFAAYVFGLLAPHVPFARLPELWGQPVRRFIELSASPGGWQWVRLAGHGDVLNLVGIAALSTGPAICLLPLVPRYLRAGDRAHAAFCLGIVALLLVAAADPWGHRS
jgi:hypothetical protein